MKFSFESAQRMVEEDRDYLHAWATKNPFSFATIVAVGFFVLGLVIG